MWLDYLQSQRVWPKSITSWWDAQKAMKKIDLWRWKLNIQDSKVHMNPAKAAVFKLQRNHRNLANEYVDNLMAYTDTARSCKNLNLTYLKNRYSLLRYFVWIFKSFVQTHFVFIPNPNPTQYFVYFPLKCST